MKERENGALQFNGLEVPENVFPETIISLNDIIKEIKEQKDDNNTQGIK